MSSFQNSFGLDAESKEYANLSGNIVSVLQAGCFFGAMASFWVSDAFGRKKALIVADIIFIIGSIVQTCAGLHTTSLAELYIGRVIGGFGVGLISAVVPTYIGENANKEIRGRCIGCMQLFKWVDHASKQQKTELICVVQCCRDNDIVLRELWSQREHFRYLEHAMAGSIRPTDASWSISVDRPNVSERKSALVGPQSRGMRHTQN